MQPMNRISLLICLAILGVTQNVYAAGGHLTRGEHPRLLLSPARIAELRLQAGNSWDLRSLFNTTRATADLYQKGPPTYAKGLALKDPMWQRDVGDAMPYIALIYAFSADKSRLEAATKWAVEAAKYPTWSEETAGHLLFGIAIVYDWCFKELDPKTRKILRDSLTEHATALVAAAQDDGSWTDQYLSNQFFVNLAGLTAAGFAVIDEVPEAQTWINVGVEAFQDARAALGPDGASHEGVDYWGSTTESMLKFFDMSRSLLGTDLYASPWLKNTTDFRVYTSLPRSVWPKQTVQDFADGTRRDWRGPGHIMRKLAREYQNGYAQYMAKELDLAHANRDTSSWLNMLWYDAKLKPRNVSDLPKLKNFADMGIVISRSDWSGHENVFFMKSGPPFGHQAHDQQVDLHDSVTHVHPDVNGFAVFGAGRYLVRHAGYQKSKNALYENTLRIGEYNQKGDDSMWVEVSDAAPTLTVVRTDDDMDYIVGDGTAAYDPNQTKLQRYKRHVVFLKKLNALLVIDDIATRGPQPLALDFHPELPAVSEPPAWISADGIAKLRIQACDPNAQVDSHTVASEDYNGKRVEIPTLTVQHEPTTAWNNAVAFTWAAAKKAPLAVTAVRTDNGWDFELNNRKVSVDTDKQTVRWE